MIRKIIQAMSMSSQVYIIDRVNRVEFVAIFDIFLGIGVQVFDPIWQKDNNAVEQCSQNV